MRLRSVTLLLAVLLVARPVFAQGWVEYASRTDHFEVPAPGQPTVETITWASEYGGNFPGRVYRWAERRTRYSVTVVDYSESERIHSELNHIAYSGGPGPGGVYWLVDIVGSPAYAATKYRQKPGVRVTYDAFHYIEFVPGLELQLTNPDESRSYVGIYLHENRLYILDATGPRDEAPPIIFQQSFGFLDEAGNPVRYRPFYVNRLPEPRGGQKP
ncbi:MAG TPA: hypothetical protein VGJ39_04025 [Vicinamibacterales bacterium]|jgi:hypothetical protein